MMVRTFFQKVFSVKKKNHINPGRSRNINFTIKVQCEYKVIVSEIIYNVNSLQPSKDKGAFCCKIGLCRL